jgi:hypothetical protein
MNERIGVDRGDCTIYCAAIFYRISVVAAAIPTAFRTETFPDFCHKKAVNRNCSLAPPHLSELRYSRDIGVAGSAIVPAAAPTTAQTIDQDKKAGRQTS